MSTFMANKGNIVRKWYVVDAAGKPLGKTAVIVPSAFMRLCTGAQKLLPTPLLMPIVARQQKKKLG